MKIGILSKRTGNFTGKMKSFFKSSGHQVNLYAAKDLCINDSLLDNDFYILKSKHLVYLIAGYFLEANKVPVIPNTDVSYTHKDRIETYFALKRIGLLVPSIYMGFINTLKTNLKKTYFPLISKPVFGSGSRGVKVYNSIKDFNPQDGEPLYLEKYIEGIHYLAYFIEDNYYICEKQPLTNEHGEMKLIESDKEIEEYLKKWKQNYNLLFGHLDLVRENNTNKLYVVDAGTFPEFSNWKNEIDPVSSICDLILKKISRIKKIE